jgi:hypothetical protein
VASFWQYGGWWAPIVMAGVGLAAGMAVLRKRVDFRRRGYRVRRLGREEHVYEERGAEGEIRLLPFWREMLIGAPSEVYLPSEDRWDSQVPPWAHGRRAEIVERIAEYLGPRDKFVDR